MNPLFGEVNMADKWRILSRYIDLEQVSIPVYYSSTPRGPVPLLKTLFSNACRLNCKYCPFRKNNTLERGSWSVEKLVRVTMKLYSEGRIRGLFLSSSMFSDPDFVVEKEIEVIKQLREKGFRGYIHVRLMPGVSKWLLKESLEYADRVGLNLEAPSCPVFKEIAPDKGDYKVDILKRLDLLARYSRGFKGRSVDTQLIYWRELGSDLEYLKLTDMLYRWGLKRVYYSPFKPIKGTPLGEKKPEQKWRTHRLYQASFLIRDYGVSIEYLKNVLDESGNLPDADPKELLAEKLIRKPLKIREAEYRELLLVPGIGIVTARKIVELRRKGKLDLYNLRKLLGKRRLYKILKYVEI